MSKTATNIGGVWSATPTPFHEDLSVDSSSVERLINHHCELEISGIMFGGTCGEGPWMPLSDLEELTRVGVSAAGGRMQIAVQVTDNSARRMLANIDRVAAAGAEIAVVASPYFLLNTNSQSLFEMYREVIRQSRLPIGFYDRGKHAAYQLDSELLPELFAEPNLRVVKDSSADPERRESLLSAAQNRPDLALLVGDEFNCVPYLEAGYQGMLFGGGIFNGGIAKKIQTAVRSGDHAEALRLQARMNELMFRVYGGPKVECWMAGLKYLLVRMGLFQTAAKYLWYPLTAECRADIDEIFDGPDRDGYREDLLPARVASA